MRTLVAAVIALASVHAFAQSLPDGGRVAVDGNSVARHAADGGVIWRVSFDDTPQVQVDGGTIRVHSAAATLTDTVVSKEEAGAGFKPMLRIAWKGARADRAATTSREGPWSYAKIGSQVLIRLQHEVFGKIEPRTTQKGDAVYVSAGSAGVLDDGTFTIAELIPDWLIAHYKDLVAKREAAEKDTSPKELVVARWLQTDAPMPLSSLAGRVVLLDFWGNWCQPCVSAIPKIAKLAEAKKDLAVIGVHSKMAAERLDAFLRRRSFPAPIAVDTGETEKRYAIRQWPTYILIDRRGNVRHRGPMLPDGKLIDQLLAEKP